MCPKNNDRLPARTLSRDGIGVAGLITGRKIPLFTAINSSVAAVLSANRTDDRGLCGTELSDAIDLSAWLPLR